jgi:hypothetical protein
LHACGATWLRNLPPKNLRLKSQPPRNLPPKNLRLKSQPPKNQWAWISAA